MRPAVFLVTPIFMCDERETQLKERRCTANSRNENTNFYRIHLVRTTVLYLLMNKCLGDLINIYRTEVYDLSLIYVCTRLFTFTNKNRLLNLNYSKIPAVIINIFDFINIIFCLNRLIYLILPTYALL